MISISSRDVKCPLCPHKNDGQGKCSDCPKPVYQHWKEIIQNLFKKKLNKQEEYDKKIKELNDYFKKLENND